MPDIFDRLLPDNPQNEQKQANLDIFDRVLSTMGEFANKAIERPQKAVNYARDVIMGQDHLPRLDEVTGYIGKKHQEAIERAMIEQEAWGKRHPSQIVPESMSRSGQIQSAIDTSMAMGTSNIPKMGEKIVSRFKPNEKIQFTNPLKSENGIELVSYEWSWKPESKLNKEGDEVMKRVSDWEQAVGSGETGRDIVHKFEIKTPNGEIKNVSLESALKIMGGESAGKIKSIASTFKTITKNKIQLQSLKEKESAMKEIEKTVSSMTPPQYEIRPRGNSGAFEARMGDAVVWTNKNYLDNERYEALFDGWKSRKMKELGGGDSTELYIIGSKIGSLEKSIESLEKKLPKFEQIATTPK